MARSRCLGTDMAAGRPTKYKQEFANQAAKLCKLGATDAELAEFFEVAISTIGLWKVKHKEFSDAQKMGKDETDARVERSLFLRAMGYEHDEVDIRVIDGSVVQTPIRKFYPPDTTAAIFWLKNRKPTDWRDKTEVEATVEDITPPVDNELARRIAFILSKGLRAQKD
jgi:hypothetical protein